MAAEPRSFRGKPPAALALSRQQFHKGKMQARSLDQPGFPLTLTAVMKNNPTSRSTILPTSVVGQSMLDLVTAEELRAQFNLPSTRTVTHLRMTKRIPFVKIGYRTIRYSISAVATALAKFEVVEVGRSAK